MEIFYYSKFEKQFSRLDKNIQSIFIEKENIFKINPFDPRLKTHRLHGKFVGYWAFSINHKIRIVFSYTEDKKDVKFHSIGNHDIYE